MHIFCTSSIQQLKFYFASQSNSKEHFLCEMTILLCTRKNLQHQFRTGRRCPQKITVLPRLTLQHIHTQLKCLTAGRTSLTHPFFSSSLLPCQQAYTLCTHAWTVPTFVLEKASHLLPRAIGLFQDSGQSPPSATANYYTHIMANNQPPPESAYN